MKASAASGKVSLNSVLFATDFSAASMRALPYALGIASRFGSKLYPQFPIQLEIFKFVDPTRAHRPSATAVSA